MAKQLKYRLLALVASCGMYTPAQATRVVIDFPTAPTILFPANVTNFSCSGGTCQGTLPFSVVTANGQTSSVFIGAGGVIGLGQALPAFTSLQQLVDANVQFLAPYYQGNSPVVGGSIGVVTQQDVIAYAVRRNNPTNFGCSQNATSSQVLQCAATTEAFIQLNNLGRFVGQIVLQGDTQSSSGYVAFKPIINTSAFFADMITPENSASANFVAGYNVNGVSSVIAFTGASTFGFGPTLQVAAPVPEPTTWMTLVLGLGMLGAALRNGRRPGALHAASS